MYCKKCDKILPADSTFCPYCGNEKLEENPAVEEAAVEEAAEEQVVAADSAEPEAAPASGDVVVEAASKKTLSLTAIALAALVGVLAVACGVLIHKMVTEEDEPVETTAISTEAFTEVELFPTDYETAYPDGYDYSAQDMTQYVTLGKYTGLTATLTTSSEITEADVQDYIANMLSQYTTEETVDRAAALGDIVVIDYVGMKDGVAFEGGTANNQTLANLGASGYIPGFEDGIVGMVAGETKTIDVTFPEDYHATDLAGKAVQFTITLDAVKEKVTPEYNDTFVREHFDMDTMPQYEASVRAYLAQNREMEILAEKQEAVLTQAVDNATLLGYPENLVEDYVFQQIDYVRQYAAMYGVEYTEFTKQAIGMTAGAYEAEVRASASDAVKQELVLFAIAQAEGLGATEEEMADAQAYYLENYQVEDVASLCEQVGITEQYFNNTVKFSVVYANVLDYLVENATFTGAK